MPSKPLRPCHQIGCNQLTRERYCQDHVEVTAQDNKQRYKLYDQTKRDKEAASFYHSKEWKTLREQALVRDKGLCVRCKENKRITPADVVDHIIPIKVRWSFRLILDNLQSLCHKCHNQKTFEDKKKYKKG